MSLKSTTTPWFSGKSRPTRIGVYQRVFNTLPEAFVPVRYAYWNGVRWCVNESTPDRAYKFRHHESRFQDMQWRGLMEPA